MSTLGEKMNDLQPGSAPPGDKQRRQRGPYSQPNDLPKPSTSAMLGIRGYVQKQFQEFSFPANYLSHQLFGAQAASNTRSLFAAHVTIPTTEHTWSTNADDVRHQLSAARFDSMNKRYFKLQYTQFMSSPHSSSNNHHHHQNRIIIAVGIAIIAHLCFC